MENKLFEALSGTKKFTITIEVFENCASIGVQEHENHKVNYYELLGVLEAQKLHLSMNQREKNLKELKKSKK
jgi:hypothetical protein